MKRRIPAHPAAGWKDYIDGLQDAVLKEPDRIAGVLGRAYAEAMLELLLHEYFIDHEAAENLLRNGQIASFNGKISLAYVLGWLPDPLHGDLNMIREIGNYFAHRLDASTFDHPPVSDWCENLWVGKRNQDDRLFGPRGRPGRARNLYNTAMVMIGLELDFTRSRLRKCEIPAPGSSMYRGET